MLELAELGVDAYSIAGGIERPPGSPEVGGFHFTAVGVSALNHESSDAAMESRAVVEAVFAELDEIRNVIRCDLGEEHDSDLALGRFDDADFISFGGSDQFLIESDRDEFLALVESQGEECRNHFLLFYLTGHFAIVAFFRTIAALGSTAPFAFASPVFTISSTTSMPLTIFPNAL